MSSLRKPVVVLSAVALVFTTAACQKSTLEGTSGTDSGVTGNAGTGKGTDATVTTAPTTAVGVVISNFAFSPNPLTIKVGQVVTWTNNDSVTHTVTSGANRTPDGKYDHSLAPGASWSHQYTQAGTFDYYCKPHANMVAKVIVQ